jgi:hypothetical protein
MAIGAMLSVGCIANPATAQEKSLKEAIIGPWLITAVFDEYQSGEKKDNWGGQVKGQTTNANELVAAIHDRVPVILALRPDPSGVMRQFPADLMRMWPISTRVNKPENDDPLILEPFILAADVSGECKFSEGHC